MVSISLPLRLDGWMMIPHSHMDPDGQLICQVVPPALLRVCLLLMVKIRDKWENRCCASCTLSPSLGTTNMRTWRRSFGVHSLGKQDPDSHSVPSSVGHAAISLIHFHTA